MNNTLLKGFRGSQMREFNILQGEVEIILEDAEIHFLKTTLGGLFQYIHSLMSASAFG